MKSVSCLWLLKLVQDDLLFLIRHPEFISGSLLKVRQALNLPSIDRELNDEFAEYLDQQLNH